MSLNDMTVKPPTSGSALLQFFTAALRQESMAGSQQRSDFSSEEDDDIVHVNDEGRGSIRRTLIRQESIHGLGIHSDVEDEDFSGDEDHRRQHENHRRQHENREPERERAMSEDGDISKSTNAISYGSPRDKKTIAEKLQAAFGFPEVEEFVGEFSCELARSVLLRGYMYLTSNHICFYANLPGNQDVVQKEGYFLKKSKTTKQFTRYWFILKNDVLSYYSNQSDIYSPSKTIALKHALSAEPSPKNDLDFHIFMNNRKYTFRTDSPLLKMDWVKAISNSIFHAGMKGEKVKISIPLGNVLDMELNTMAFAQAIHVKAVESDESFAVEDFYFAYFNDAPKTLAALKTQFEKYQQDILQNHSLNRDHKIFDSTSLSTSASVKTGATTAEAAGPVRHRPKLLHPDRIKFGSRSSSPCRSQPTSDTEDNEKEKYRHALSFSIRGTTSWLSDHKSDFGAADSSMTTSEKEQEAFRKDFSLPDSEGLSAVVSGYLLRIVPLSGHVYLSDNYLCFKSKCLLTKKDDEIFFDFSSTETRNTILNTLIDRTTPEAQARRLKLRTQSLAAETPSSELDDPMGPRVTDSLLLREEPIHVERMSWASYPGKTARPLHITCLTIGSRGDVQPYIALCKRLMKDGHKCRISTHGEYKDWIEGHGIEFGLVGGDPGELIELCVENGMFTVSFIRESLKRFRGWLDELLDTAWESCQNTDVLIESPSAMAGIHIAERLDIPYFRAFPFPWTRTRNFPHPFAVPEHNLGRSYNYMTYVMIEQVFWKGISGQVNKWRKDTLGLGPTSLEKMDAHHVPSLYSWSPHLVPAPGDWHSWVHVTGYWFLDNPDLTWTPPKDLVAFLKADPNNKPVYIGFGSMVVPDPDGMTRAIINAVVKSGVRAIISKGWSDRLTSQDDPLSAASKAASEEIVYPPSIYMLKSVPHDWLFPQLAGCVHHGGAGTAAAGLRAGIPTVIKPFFGDQYFWAQRLEEAGVGVWCHELTVKKLTSALVTITTDEKMIRKAQMMGEKIRAEDGVGEAIHYLYHDLTLAKGRLHKLRKEKAEDTPVKFKVQEAGDDWWIVQPSSGASGATSGNEGSESTAGLNMLSGSEEDMVSIPSEHTTPQLGAFTDLQHSVSLYERAHSRTGSDAEPLSHSTKQSATDPGSDRAIEMIEKSDQSAEELAAQLEAMHLPSRSPLPFFAHAFGQGESAHDKGKDKSKDGNSKSVKRTSTARKVIETLATKATHVTGYFSPSNLHPHASQQPTPPPLLIDPPQPSGSSVSSNNSTTSTPVSSVSGDRPLSSRSQHKATPSFDAKDASKVAINLTTANRLR
ncbi:hypothetical protein BC939DRAFT_503666 [Gamsiella multidivaricata]|uniref:uncharacterized protein n=1 Tax=Gamsiella multidivaricata TaxID=101098 RepID=UPI00221FBF1E|nr:uncharacterized protein BC939DRAFT_503666 [Gamsiella multidivaricata]KAI7822657.1 hypothetical protein BC939DRAFT_503666 [Gamsiella multidivaricata]